MKTKSRQANIGLLKQRVTFQKFNLSSDGMGGNSQTWEDVDTVWASVSAVSGRESFEIGGLKDKVRYKILTRFRSDFNTGNIWSTSEELFSTSTKVWNEPVLASESTYNFLLRALYNGRYFNIEYAQDRSEERAYSEMIAVEDVNAQQ